MANIAIMVFSQPVPMIFNVLSRCVNRMTMAADVIAINQVENESIRGLAHTNPDTMAFAIFLANKISVGGFVAVSVFVGESIF